MMIPRTLTITQAQYLLARGRTRQQSPECLTTPRAIYYWNADTQQYEREADFRSADGAPRPSTSTTREAWYWVIGILFLLVLLAPVLVLSLPVILFILPALFLVLIIAAGVLLGGWVLSRVLSERR
jgi:hypothetical protein